MGIGHLLTHGFLDSSACLGGALDKVRASHTEGTCYT